MESRQQKYDRYISNLGEHISRTRESARYSSDRLDILIISLATTSLVFSIGFVKDFIPDIKCIDTTTLKLSWIFLISSLISNLISQSTGLYSHTYEIKVSNNLIRKKRGKKLKGKQNLNLFLSEKLGWLTSILNWISLILLIAGMIILLNFFSKNI